MSERLGVVEQLMAELIGAGQDRASVELPKPHWSHGAAADDPRWRILREARLANEAIRAGLPTAGER